MYTEHLFFPLSYRATATLVILLQRYWDMENHLVTETHYSPSQTAFTFLSSCETARSRQYRVEVPIYPTPIYLSFLVSFSSKRDPTSVRGGSCTVTSDPYRTINASSATIKRAQWRMAPPRLSRYYK